MPTHQSELGFQMLVEATLRGGEKLGFIAATDLTSEAVALAAPKTRSLTKHQSEMGFAYTSIPRALKLSKTVRADALTGASLTNIYNDIQGTVKEGLVL